MSIIRLGLLGEKLGHSYSPLIYASLGLPDYQLFQIPPSQVEAFVRSGKLNGLNVTIPYKKTVLPFCDTLSDSARRLGNVNTLLFGANGSIHGYNTDYPGFIYLMQRAGLVMRGKKVVILGSGGTAETARLAAQDAGASAVVQISRTGEDHYGNLQRHADAKLLINATPVGMYPHNEDLPVSLDAFPALEGVVDVIYNPLRTRLMLEAEARGIPCAGGLAMLAEQGRAAAEIFLGQAIDPKETERIHRILLQQTENLVIIGMPGSGKSTLGQAVAQEMNRIFVDTDLIILEQTGHTPGEIIDKEGESAFRQIESSILISLAKGSRLVIATGGGAVLSEENRMALRQNGRVYWLCRPLEDLAVEDRPLSQDLSSLYATRYPSYEAAADYRLNLAETLEKTVQEVINEFYEYTDSKRPESEPAGKA